MSKNAQPRLLLVFVLLAITELLSLVWRGDEAGPGDPGLATFSVITIGLALAALIMAPALYLFVPVLLPLDLVPHGLKKALAPKLTGKQGRGFVRILLNELRPKLGAKLRLDAACETEVDLSFDERLPLPRRIHLNQ